MKAKPFIKWAGGKRKLVPELVKRMPSSYGTYFEPFLGGGALFFELEPRKAILSDLNSDLTRTYWAVDHCVEDLIFKLDILEAAHRKGGLEHYLKVRAQNSAKLAQVDCAARLIYLNKTCFNGLYRVNKSGQFNVPMGKFKSPPLICDADNLRECSKVLSGIEVNYSEPGISTQGKTQRLRLPQSSLRAPVLIGRLHSLHRKKDSVRKIRKSWQPLRKS